MVEDPRLYENESVFVCKICDQSYISIEPEFFCWGFGGHGIGLEAEEMLKLRQS